MSDTLTLLLLDAGVWVVVSFVILGVMKLYHWYKGTGYQREAIVGDLSICFVSVFGSSVFVTILPAIETACLPSSQKTVLGIFKIIPAVILALSVAGLLFVRNIHKLKVNIAILGVSGLILGIMRAVDDLEPCAPSEVSKASDPVSVDWTDVGGAIAYGIMLVAAVITIFEWIRKRRARNKQRRQKSWDETN